MRCAIYTRKSSDEGLEQSFSSLDAQREACAAYITSQSHEGWVATAKIYDDGGFSGGSMDRPALKRLLADIELGEVDTIVVYKIDRLTRSLSDFSRMVELFDSKAVSFVSITQQFNTTTSMGRLTLNILLSFAQFEREITGERIRDKIAASKAKGMWMGGNVLLGYDLKDRALVINEVEAEQVRYIFHRYIELGSVHELARALEREDIRSKVRTTLKGKPLGGALFSRGALYCLLKNRHYRGDIIHKDALHPGLHPAIVDADLFNSVQFLLSTHRRRGPSPAQKPSAKRPKPEDARLTGRLFDAEGEPMCPTVAHGRAGRIYRYYVSALLQAGVAAADAPSLAPRRVSGPRLEDYVHRELQRLSSHPDCDWSSLSSCLVRIDLRPATVELVVNLASLPRQPDAKLFLIDLRRRLQPDEAVVREGKSGAVVRISLPVRPQFRGGRTWRSSSGQPTAVPAEPNSALVAALRSAHRKLEALNVSPLCSLGQLSHAAAPDTAYDRRVSQLAFLAPELQLAILEGRQPPALTLKTFVEQTIPLRWDEQRRWWRAIF